MNTIVKLSFAAILVLLINAASDGDTQQPNVLFILVDDLGWRDVGFNGSTAYETPSVDKLASQGMALSDFYSAGPVCSPTRASILTGKYPARLHITRHLLAPDRDPKHMLDHLPLAEFTIAEASRKTVTPPVTLANGIWDTKTSIGPTNKDLMLPKAGWICPGRGRFVIPI